MLNNRAELHRLRLNRSSPQTWRRSHRQNRSNEESELDERQIHPADARPCGYEAARGPGLEYELKFDSLSRGRSQGAACSAHADAQNAVCEVRKMNFPPRCYYCRRIIWWPFGLIFFRAFWRLHVAHRSCVNSVDPRNTPDD
jgi:hypothetical protein